MNECFLGSSAETERTAECDLRDRLIVLMSHKLLLQGESVRRLEFADLFVQVPNASDITPVKVLMMRMDQENGRSEFSSVIRHKDPLLCAFNALAFYLFGRFEINCEPLPDFHRRANWYFQKLIRTVDSRDPCAEMSWTAYDEVFKRMFERAGVTTTSIEHIVRWQGSALNTTTLNSATLQAKKIQAGFKDQPGRYYLPRASVIPPKTLQNMIFPQAEGWLARFRNRDAEVQPDKAAQNFLKLLLECRLVILQDAAILRRRFPNLSILSHKVFRHPDFEAFANRVCAVHDSAEKITPPSLRLQETIPEIAQAPYRREVLTNGLSARQEQQIARPEQRTANLKDKIADLNKGQEQQAASLTSQLSQVFASRGQHSRGAQLPNQQGRQQSQYPPLALAQPPPPQRSNQTGPWARALAFQPSAAPSVHAYVLPNGYWYLSEAVNTPVVKPVVSPEKPVEKYVMNRTLTTVADAWLEWDKGLYQCPSVRSLEERFGVRWRMAAKDKRYYQRRKKLMDIIDRRIREGASAALVVREMDDERRRLGLSLDKYRAYKTKMTR